MSRLPNLKRVLLGVLISAVATLAACADNEQPESAQMMDRSGQSGLGQMEPRQIEEGSTDADAPPVRASDRDGRSDARKDEATGRYQWNGNPERLTVGGTSSAATRRPIPTPDGKTAATTPQTPPDAKVVIVQAGDTLHGIADRHDVTVASLTQANRLTGGPLRVGQRLVLPPVAR